MFKYPESREAHREARKAHMGLFGWFKKKDAAPAAAPAEAAEEGGDAGGGSGGEGGGGSGNLAVKLDMMSIDITKINATISALKEINKSTNERFATIQEQLGEIRGQLTDTNRNMGFLEVKATKAADLVESVHPDRLMIQVQKMDGKIEGLRAVIESKDAMLQNVMDQLKKARAELMIYQGVEQVIKMSEEVKTEIFNAKKLVSMIERHSDKVENVFIESQRTYKDFSRFSATIEGVKAELKDVGHRVEKFDIALAGLVKTKDFEDKIGKIETSDKHMKEILKKVEDAHSKLNERFEELKSELRGAFDRRIYKAEVMTRAVEQIVKENPAILKGLDLDKFFAAQFPDAAGGAGGSAKPADSAKAPDASAPAGGGDAKPAEAAKPAAA